MQFISNGEGVALATPNHWTYLKLQGFDSYVGAIATGENDTLYFDFGKYSSPLDHAIYRNDDDEEEFKSKVYWKLINGRNVKFASHWTKTNSDFGIHFDSLWKVGSSDDFRNRMKLTIYGVDLNKRTKKDLVKAIENIQFVRKQTAANIGLPQYGPFRIVNLLNCRGCRKLS